MSVWLASTDRFGFPRQGAAADARPRPRLSWREPDADHPAWRLVLRGDVCVGSVGVFGSFNFLRDPAPFESQGLRDAVICLRLQVLADGFEVDDVPDVILACRGTLREEMREIKQRVATSTTDARAE